MSVVIIRSTENKCQELLKQKDIRFVGVINRLGNLIAGGFRSDVIPLDTEEKLRMLYMQHTLEGSMRKEFDESLGEVDYTISRRRKTLMITIPMEDNLLLISASPKASAEKIIIDASRIFSKIGEDGI